jgi:hypothetical protein
MRPAKEMAYSEKSNNEGCDMRFLPKLLEKAIRKGKITVIESDSEERILGGFEVGSDVAIRITYKSFDWRIFHNPELYAAEAYMDGKLIMDAEMNCSCAYFAKGL